MPWAIYPRSQYHNNDWAATISKELRARRSLQQAPPSRRRGQGYTICTLVKEGTL